MTPESWHTILAVLVGAGISIAGFVVAQWQFERDDKRRREANRR